MKNKIQKYKALNIKLTPQRIAILDYLDGNKEHPSVIDIYRHVSKKFPSMSFATVYNTLNVLSTHGRIKELSIDTQKKRIDPNIHTHHHLICINCKKIIDIELDYPLTLPYDKANGFEVIDNHIEFFGICSECRAEKIH